MILVILCEKKTHALEAIQVLKAVQETGTDHEHEQFQVSKPVAGLRGIRLSRIPSPPHAEIVQVGEIL